MRALLSLLFVLVFAFPKWSSAQDYVFVDSFENPVLIAQTMSGPTIDLVVDSATYNDVYEITFENQSSEEIQIGGMVLEVVLPNSQIPNPFLGMRVFELSTDGTEELREVPLSAGQQDCSQFHPCYFVTFTDGQSVSLSVAPGQMVRLLVQATAFKPSSVPSNIWPKTFHWTVTSVNNIIALYSATGAPAQVGGTPGIGFGLRIN
jgi:hypothetical protein